MLEPIDSRRNAAAGPPLPGMYALLRSIRLVAFDFDGVFTDNTVWVSEDGIESVRCWRSDGLGLQHLRNLGIESVILSTEQNPVVTTRSRKLGVRCVQGCSDKRDALSGLLADAGYGFEQTAFVGNDINDVACLAVVGLPILVNDAHVDVLAFGRLRTIRAGGYGAVREVCDWFRDAHAAVPAKTAE